MKKANYITKSIENSTLLDVLGIRLLNCWREGDAQWFEYDDEYYCNELIREYSRDYLTIKKYGGAVQLVLEMFISAKYGI